MVEPPEESDASNADGARQLLLKALNADGPEAGPLIVNLTGPARRSSRPLQQYGMSLEDFEESGHSRE